MIKIIKTSVVLTEAADLDVALYGVSETALATIARNLLLAPVATTDAFHGTIREREILGYVVLFESMLNDGERWIVIDGIRPPQERPFSEKVLNILGKLAIIRGAGGF